MRSFEGSDNVAHDQSLHFTAIRLAIKHHQRHATGVRFMPHVYSLRVIPYIISQWLWWYSWHKYFLIWYQFISKSQWLLYIDGLVQDCDICDAWLCAGLLYLQYRAVCKTEVTHWGYHSLAPSHRYSDFYWCIILPNFLRLNFCVLSHLNLGHRHLFRFNSVMYTPLYLSFVSSSTGILLQWRCLLKKKKLSGLSLNTLKTKAALCFPMACNKLVINPSIVKS